MAISYYFDIPLDSTVILSGTTEHAVEDARDFAALLAKAVGAKWWGDVGPHWVVVVPNGPPTMLWVLGSSDLRSQFRHKTFAC